MSCETKVCKARCCYNIPFEHHETEVYAEFIVNPVLSLRRFPNGAYLAVTSYNPAENKCPFLRKDCKCNIYHNRPEVCRLMGTIPKLHCDLYKQD